MTQTDGVMHACGHDAHMTMVLGAARLLSAMELPGTVKLILQPFEEGGAGADKMIQEGVFAVNVVNCQGLWPCGP